MHLSPRKMCWHRQALKKLGLYIYLLQGATSSATASPVNFSKLTCCTKPCSQEKSTRKNEYLSKKPYVFSGIFRTQTFTNSSQDKIQCINLTNQEIAQNQKQTLIHLGSGKNQEQNLIFHLESVTGVQLPSLKARRAAVRSCFSPTLLSSSSNAHSSRQHIHLLTEKTCPENSLIGIGKVLQMSSSVNILEVLILKEMYSRIFILFER